MNDEQQQPQQQQPSEDDNGGDDGLRKLYSSMEEQRMDKVLGTLGNIKRKPEVIGRDVPDEKEDAGDDKKPPQQ